MKYGHTVEYDKAAYLAEGGDARIDEWKKRHFTDPGNVDEALMAKAREVSRAAYGSEKWQFVIWWYERHGGKFNV